MKYKYFIILLAKLLFAQSKLLFVFELFRHGTRSPGFGKKYLKNNYTDVFGVVWNVSSGLTPIGKRMQYVLGLKNRKKYSNFISEQYDQREILVYSTTTERALMSAQAQLMGFYQHGYGEELERIDIAHSLPPNVNHDFHQGDDDNFVLPFGVQIVPIFPYDKEEIFTILTKSDICPYTSEIKKKNRKQEKLLKFYQKLNNTYGEQLMKFFNKNDSSFLFNYRNVFAMSDIFLADYWNNKNLSKFESYGIDLKKFAELSVEMKSLFLFDAECNEELAGLSYSITMPKILKWMEKKIEEEKKKGDNINLYNRPKFVMYSGHDTTIAPLELLMKKAFNTELIYPNYGANIFFELHERNNEYFVEYYFNDKAMLNITYEEFKKNITTALWKKEKIESLCQNSFSFKGIGFILGFILLICIGFISIFFIYKKLKEIRTSEDREMTEVLNN